MGCGTAKERLEDNMMVYKLERMEIQMEKEKEIKKLEEITGKEFPRHKIPDYIDPKFAKEKKIYEEEDPEGEAAKAEGSSKAEGNSIKEKKKKGKKSKKTSKAKGKAKSEKTKEESSVGSKKKKLK